VTEGTVSQSKRSKKIWIG